MTKKFSEEFFEKSYKTYLKKISDAQMKEVVKNGKITIIGRRMQQPRAYEQYKQIYSAIYEETGGVNVLRQIVTETRATSEKQAKLAYKLAAKAGKYIQEEGGKAKIPSLKEIRQMRNEKVGELIEESREKIESFYEKKPERIPAEFQSDGGASSAARAEIKRYLIEVRSP